MRVDKAKICPFLIRTFFDALFIYISYYVFSALFWMILNTPWVVP